MDVIIAPTGARSRERGSVILQAGDCSSQDPKSFAPLMAALRKAMPELKDRCVKEVNLFNSLETILQ